MSKKIMRQSKLSILIQIGLIKLRMLKFSVIYYERKEIKMNLIKNKSKIIENRGQPMAKSRVIG